MPVTPTYPGDYIEEVPSGVRTITGVATSITAFVGMARRGPVNAPVTIGSFAEFERVFGGLWVDSTMSYAVRDFYQNGGSTAVIVRIHGGATAATITLAGGVSLVAANPGLWGESLRVRVDFNTRDRDDDTLYNLTIRDMATGAEERFLNISTEAASPRSLDKVLSQSSDLVRVTGAAPFPRPDASADVPPGIDPFSAAAPANASTAANADGGDGGPLTDAAFRGSRADKTGIYALLNTDLFNILCLPPISRSQDLNAGTTIAEALALCNERRAVLLVDSPAAWDSVADAVAGVDGLGLSGTAARNAALYFPRLRTADPLQEGLIDNFPPCGAVAGIFARTDSQRGVWKAPAGVDAALAGVLDLSVKLTDGENGQANPLGINCLCSFPGYGRIVWGARTARGADRLADEYKYLPVRRLALFIEESLFRGTQWVVFEPNDEPLWSQIRLNIGAFMQGLFRQGAFQGSTPRDAYFVKCDKETTTQNDINQGIVNIVVGFAPLKPAEFVIIKLQQMAGQVAA
jgi:phage tail sheath protein FI